MLHHHILYMVLFTFGLVGCGAVATDWVANLLNLSGDWSGTLTPSPPSRPRPPRQRRLTRAPR